MVTLHTSSLHRQAKELLDRSRYSPKRLVLIHTAVALGSTLLVTVMNYLLNLQIANTGGLSGLDARSILSTIQPLLELVVAVALPFWQIGLLYAALRWAKGESADTSDLFAGFRRFGTVLGFRFLYGGLFFALGFSLFYFSSSLFMMTPWAAPLMELFSPILDATTPEQLEALLTPELMQQAVSNMVPLFVFSGVLFLAAAIPLFYRLRFSEFFLMEGKGAARSIVLSIKLTRKNSLQLLKLDVHFWWFYLLQLLTVAVSYGDAIAAMLGISLPISADAGFFLFYVLGILLQGILVWQCQATLTTSYCLAYSAFQEMPSALNPSDAPQNA